VLNQQVDRSVLTQIRLPFPMPSAVSCMLQAVSSCANCAPADFTTGDDSGDSFMTSFVEQRADRTSMGVCGRCVHLVDYDAFLQGVLSSAKGGKGYGRGYKRRKTDTHAKGRRKTAAVADEPYLPSTRTGRASSDGAVAFRGQRCASRASRMAEPRAVAEDCAADSALLLNMRREQSNRFSDDSSSTSGSSYASPRRLYREDACYSEAEFAAARDCAVTGLKRKLGKNAAVELSTPLASPGSAYAGYFSRPPSAAPETLLPYAFDGCVPYRATAAEPAGYLMAGAGVALSGLAISTAYAAEEEMAPPDDGCALQDFLTACYRDGMYPSPVLSAAAQHAQHAHLHYYFGAQAELAAQQAADEGAYVERSAGTETDTAWTGSASAAAMHLQPARQEDGRELDASAGEMMVAQDEGDQRYDERAYDSDRARSCLDAPAFAYDELQLLLSQLLHESAGREGNN
jgi:hypothetical protein